MKYNRYPKKSKTTGAYCTHTALIALRSRIINSRQSTQKLAYIFYCWKFMWILMMRDVL
jgi:hypothetical protein